MDHQLSETEGAELSRLIDETADEELKKQLRSIWEDYAAGRDLSPTRSQLVLDYILAHDRQREGKPDNPALPASKTNPARHILMWVVAASLFALVVGYGVFMISRERITGQVAARSGYSGEDVSAGGNRAVLTLAGGRRIILDSARNGQLASQGNTSIIKGDSGLLTYQAGSYSMQNGNSSPMPLQYNTLSTPRGGTYQLVLPDGSKVWLNAASSIRYPTAFTAKQRQVEMTGEVYFEIAPRKNQPFKVKVNEMEVDVLGTHFDINAYTDESAIKTTLLTGKVKVKGGEQVRMLTAGQQVRLNRQGELNLIRHVDVASVVAWKRGLFYFDNADLPTIMRQLSRWYDIAVVYKAGSDSGRRFNGQVFRSLNLSQVLKVLELGGIHFRLEAKKLIVLP